MSSRKETISVLGVEVEWKVQDEAKNWFDCFSFGQRD